MARTAGMGFAHNCSNDANGNVTSDGTNQYTWNEFSKLASVNDAGTMCEGGGVCPVYDAFGRIVEVDSGSESAGHCSIHGGCEITYRPVHSQIWYTQLGKTAYMNGATYNYAYWPTPGGGTLLNTSSGGNFYMHKDWLGSARIISSVPASGNGAVLADQAFAPYGEQYDVFGSTAQNQINFTGLTQDVLGGMYDTPNRELQGSQQGRWLSPDPARSGWNQYAYATNPNSFIDPSGLKYCLYAPAPGCITPSLNGDGALEYSNWEPQYGYEFGPTDGGTGGANPSSIALGESGVFWGLTAGMDGAVASEQLDPIAAHVDDNGFLQGDYPGEVNCSGSGGCLVWNPSLQGGNGAWQQSGENDNSNNGGILNSIMNWFNSATLLGGGGSLWIPLHPKIPVGVSPGANFVSDGTKDHGCLSLIAGGVGVKSPGGSAGLLFGDPSQAFNIIKGWSVTLNVNTGFFGLGGQVIASSAGTLAGPTVGTPGMSLQVGYGGPCE